jgi:hypothetical protein
MFHIPTSSPKITRKFGLSEAFADEAMARNSHYASDANRMGGGTNDSLDKTGCYPRKGFTLVDLGPEIATFSRMPQSHGA